MIHMKATMQLLKKKYEEFMILSILKGQCAVMKPFKFFMISLPLKSYTKHKYTRKYEFAHLRWITHITRFERCRTL